jgi:N-acetylglucosaminyldiphosphoundecaprenol N-acetyl-beta-D-mannosaminyltransferase
MLTTYPVIDAKIVGTTMSDALEMVMDRADASAGGYACFVNAHVAVMTRQENGVKSAVGDATYAFSDGMPVYLVGKYLHGLDIEKISGPDFLARMFASERGRKLRHYFYGSKPEVLEKLMASLKERYPGCNIVGSVSPPFRKWSEKEQTDELDAIRDSGTQIVWVGLGAPKQEYWMQENAKQVPKAMLMGVGAAFDFHAGTIKRAPEWAQRWGLEWVHRFLQEPVRLWKRYFVTNSLFIFFSLRDFLARLSRRSS